MLKNNNSNKRGLNEKKNIELHFFFWQVVAFTAFQ